MRKLVGLDCETHDPHLKTRGWSWKYGEGKVLVTSLYFADRNIAWNVPGLKNENSPYSEANRKLMNEEIIKLLKDPEVSIVGANLQYDLGWLLYEYGMTTYDVKCRIIDVLIAEHILNEYSRDTLDSLSWRYLKYGKRSTNIESWVMDNVKGARGDFRKYLLSAPWDLLEEYVSGDSENPIRIWKKQLTLLMKLDLVKRCKLEFEVILPILQITMNGFPFDNEQRKANLAYLTKYRDQFKKEFLAKYNMEDFKVGSGKQVAEFLHSQKIPYNHKIALKGKDGEIFADNIERDKAFFEARKIVSSMRFVKKIPTAYVPYKLAPRTEDLLREAGFMFTSNPNIDKIYLNNNRDTYPILGILADWRQCNSIISKILGDAYERFISPDGRIRPQYNSCSTLSYRLSSLRPNGQQIPSKGKLVLKDGTEISFPAITRALFHGINGLYGKIDSGQIEYRLICNIAVGAGSEEVRALFKENPRLDFHQYVMGLTGLGRKLAKNMSFGKSFGMKTFSMASTFGWTIEETIEIEKQYDEHMPFVEPTLQLVGDIAEERGYIKTAYGARAHLRGPKYTMLNRYTQGSGAEILKLAMAEAYKLGIWQKLPMHIQVHDELGFSFNPVMKDIETMYQLSDVMCNCIDTLRVPLIADIEFGENWASTKTVPEWIELREEAPQLWNKTSDKIKETVSLCEEMEERRKICA